MPGQHATDEADAWARRLAAQLPPFTADEIADLGRLAATIDARRRTQHTQPARAQRAA